MGKGEIARYEQFLLFSQCFQKACFPGASKGVIVWEWVKSYLHNLESIVVSGGRVIEHQHWACVQYNRTRYNKTSCKGDRMSAAGV